MVIYKWMQQRQYRLSKIVLAFIERLPQNIFMTDLVASSNTLWINIMQNTKYKLCFPFEMTGSWNAKGKPNVSLHTKSS